MTAPPTLLQAATEPLSTVLARLSARLPAWLAAALDNAAGGLAALVRRPRPVRPFVPTLRRFGCEIPFAAAAVGLVMATLDDPLGHVAAALPEWLLRIAFVVTDSGLSGWILVPSGTALVLMTLVPRSLDRMSRAVFAMVAVRTGFVFVAVGLPGLVSTVVKRGIGRGRPSDAGPFAYEPLSWKSAWASLPSGHATTAFATLVALGALFPRLRPALWVYALAVAASRVMVSAHYPSDVMAGAAFGALGALLVRDWFAVRRLGFRVGTDGRVRARAGPGLRRMVRVAGRLIGTTKQPDAAWGLSTPCAGPGAEVAMADQAHHGDRTPRETPRVSIVVPVRNEAGNVAPLVEEIGLALATFAPIEVVYVNDGSQDGTEAELRSLMATRPWLRQIRHEASCGQSAAVRSGVAAARAPLIATLDGDGQNDPAFLPALVTALERDPGLGLVAGQRVGRKASGFKRLQSRIANGVRKAVLRDGTRDTGCGLKGFRRDVFLALPYFDGLHRFLPALVARDGFKVAYVDVVDRPRLSGVSNYGMWDRLWVGLLDLAGVWWLIRRRRRVPHITEVQVADVPPADKAAAPPAREAATAAASGT